MGKDKVKRKRQAIVGRFLYWGKGGCTIQKLIYENLHGETAVFFHAPWVLGRGKGVGMSDVKVVAAEGAYQQGESITGLFRFLESLLIAASIAGGFLFSTLIAEGLL